MTAARPKAETLPKEPMARLLAVMAWLRDPLPWAVAGALLTSRRSVSKVVLTKKTNTVNHRVFIVPSL